MNHYGMIGAENISTCQNCLAYLARLGPGAKKECLDCYYATEYGEPSIEQASSLTGVPFEANDENLRLKSDVPQPWARDQWQSVQQLRAMVLHLNNKVTEMRAKKKNITNNYEPF